jgi:hypothetical protein
VWNELDRSISGTWEGNVASAPAPAAAAAALETASLETAGAEVIGAASALSDGDESSFFSTGFAGGATGLAGRARPELA